MGEQQCPYWEEFDGNDYSASHLIAYVDDEPVARCGCAGSSLRHARAAGVLQRFRGHNVGLFLLDRCRDRPQSRGRKMGYPSPAGRHRLLGEAGLAPAGAAKLREGWPQTDRRHEASAFDPDLAVPEVEAPEAIVLQPRASLDPTRCRAVRSRTDPMVLNRHGWRPSSPLPLRAWRGQEREPPLERWKDRCRVCESVDRTRIRRH